MAETPLGILISILRYFFLGVMIYIAVNIAARSVIEYKHVKSANRYADMNRVNSIRFIMPESLACEVVELYDSNTIGSDEDCDICVENSSMLPLHAELFERNGIYFIKTKFRGSAEINGRPVGRLAAPLHFGDTITLEDICFVCESKTPDGHRGSTEAADE